VRSYQSTVEIEAPPDAVWAVLVDGAQWPQWDSGVLSLDGPIAPGAKLKIIIAANPGRAFPLTVTDFRPGSSMTWSGGMPLGLFRGVRQYRLTQRPGGLGTTFLVREEYTGALLPLIWRTMPDLQPSFDQFARGLKARVERDS
jgi:hypothetical protein